MTSDIFALRSATEGMLTLKNLTELMQKGVTSSGSINAHTPDLYMVNKKRLRGKHNHFRYREIMRQVKMHQTNLMSHLEMMGYPPGILAAVPKTSKLFKRRTTMLGSNPDLVIYDDL